MGRPEAWNAVLKLSPRRTARSLPANAAEQQAVDREARPPALRPEQAPLRGPALRLQVARAQVQAQLPGGRLDLLGPDVGEPDRVLCPVDVDELAVDEVDRHFALRRDDCAAAEGVDPFQGVAGQAFIGIALEHKAPHVGIALGAFGIHDFLRCRSHLRPGGRNFLAVLFEQVGAGDHAVAVPVEPLGLGTAVLRQLLPVAAVVGALLAVAAIAGETGTALSVEDVRRRIPPLTASD